MWLIWLARADFSNDEGPQAQPRNWKLTAGYHVKARRQETVMPPMFISNVAKLQAAVFARQIPTSQNSTIRNTRRIVPDPSYLTRRNLAKTAVDPSESGGDPPQIKTRSTR
ncbi:hypothetical protein KCP69_13780 [Salmonella enterica subsp. enterica]|nr:hypothetical protein KCP69_13780 [Salmonella enterica subsp. enterica]